MDKKARIAVLVSGGGTNLQAILDASARGEIPDGEIAMVISDRSGAYALERAEKAGIPALEINKKACGGQEAFEKKLIAALTENRIDLIVLAGFLSILTENFTTLYPRRIINVHPSLIPSFCGAGFYGLKVHQAALNRGVKVTGATVHFVNEIPDGGEIIAQKAVDIEPGFIFSIFFSSLSFKSPSIFSKFNTSNFFFFPPVDLLLLTLV